MNTKRILSLVLVIVLSVLALTSCGFINNLFNKGPQLEDAVASLTDTYKDTAGKETTKDFDIVGKVILDGAEFTVTWASDNKDVVVKPAAKDGWYTVDVPDENATPVNYKLTATITDAKGNTASYELALKLPVYQKQVEAVSTLEENTPYKVHIAQMNLAKHLFATMEISSSSSGESYIKMTTNLADSVDFYAEKSGEGYKFYVKDGDAKKYVTASVTETVVEEKTKYIKCLNFADTTETVWMYNDNLGIWYFNTLYGDYVLGNYGTYETVSMSQSKYYTADTVGLTQFVVKFITAEQAAALEPIVLPIPDEITSIADANAIAAELASGATTVAYYRVKGTITEIQDGYYGNMIIADEDGNSILIYGLNSKDGSTKYGNMTDKPVVGDTITVVSKIKNYNGNKPELENAMLYEVVKGETQEPEVDPVVPPTAAVPAPTGKYHLVITQKNVNKNLYLTGATANKDYYIATVDSTEGAMLFEVEAVDGVDGAFRIFFYNAENVKTYIEMYQDGTYFNLKLTAEVPATYYTYDAEYNTAVCEFEDGAKKAYFGAYKNYETASGSSYDYISTSFPAVFVEVEAPKADEPSDELDSATYIGTDDWGNQSLTVVIDDTTVTFNYTPPFGNATTASYAYAIVDGALVLYAADGSELGAMFGSVTLTDGVPTAATYNGTDYTLAVPGADGGDEELTGIEGSYTATNEFVPYVLNVIVDSTTITVSFTHPMTGMEVSNTYEYAMVDGAAVVYVDGEVANALEIAMTVVDGALTVVSYNGYDFAIATAEGGDEELTGIEGSYTATNDNIPFDVTVVVTSDTLTMSYTHPMTQMLNTFVYDYAIVDGDIVLYYQGTQDVVNLIDAYATVLDGKLVAIGCGGNDFVIASDDDQPSGSGSGTEGDPYVLELPTDFNCAFPGGFIPVWYSFTAAINGTVTVSASGVDAPWIFYGTDIMYAYSNDGATTSETFDVVAGTTYYVGIADWDEQAADIAVSITISESTGPVVPDGTFTKPYELVAGEGQTLEFEGGYNYVFYKYTATEQVSITVTVNADDYDFGFGYAQYEINSDNLNATKVITLEADETIYLALSTYSGDRATISFDVVIGAPAEIEPNGSYDYPYVIEQFPYESVAQTSVYGTVYYTFTASATGYITLNIASESLETAVFGSYAGDVATPQTVKIAVLAGKTYSFSIYNEAAASHTISATFEESSLASDDLKAMIAGWSLNNNFGFLKTAINDESAEQVYVINIYTSDGSTDAYYTYDIVVNDDGSFTVTPVARLEKSVGEDLFVNGATITITEGEYGWNYELDIVTPEEVVDMAYGLEKDTALEGTYTLTGVVNQITYAWSANGGISFTLQIGDLSDKLITCFKLTGANANIIATGDTVTVTGTIKNYDGTIEFDKPTLVNLVGEDLNNRKVDFEANALKLVTSYNADATVDLAAAGSTHSDVAITWTVNGEAATQLVVTQTSEAQTITVVATVAYGDYSVTKTFTVEVDAKAAAGSTITTKADFNTVDDNTKYGTYSSTNGWTVTNGQVVVPTGSNGITDTAFVINGKTSAVGSITSPTLSNGVQKVSFNYTHIYNEPGAVNVTINIKQNDAVVATTTLAVDSITKYSVYDFEWTLDNVITGDFVVEIVNNCPSQNTSNKDRLAIWNLQIVSAPVAG